MRTRSTQLTLLLLITLPLTSCGLLGTTTPPEAETVASVCEKVLDCGGWGWFDLDECEASFLDDPDAGTDCDDPTGYLECMPDCMDRDCDAFDICEGDCWAGSCE